MTPGLVLLGPALAACLLCFGRLVGGAVPSVMQHTWAGRAGLLYSSVSHKLLTLFHFDV